MKRKGRRRAVVRRPPFCRSIRHEVVVDNDLNRQRPALARLTQPAKPAGAGTPPRAVTKSAYWPEPSKQNARSESDVQAYHIRWRVRAVTARSCARFVRKSGTRS